MAICGIEAELYTFLGNMPFSTQNYSPMSVIKHKKQAVIISYSRGVWFFKNVNSRKEGSLSHILRTGLNSEVKAIGVGNSMGKAYIE